MLMPALRRAIAITLSMALFGNTMMLAKHCTFFFIGTFHRIESSFLCIPLQYLSSASSCAAALRHLPFLYATSVITSSRQLRVSQQYCFLDSRHCHETLLPTLASSVDESDRTRTTIQVKRTPLKVMCWGVRAVTIVPNERT